jgi:probable phosphomutase (TIGR03848 family)
MKNGTTTFLLIRHAAHVLGGGTIAGRMEKAVLSEAGWRQAQRTADRVAAANVPIQAIYASPVVRVQQTAGVLASRLGLPVATDDALAEIDYGDWTGRTLDELRPNEQWARWNAFRSGTRVPGGERMLETQSRIVHFILDLRARHDGETVAIVSHGDVIKAAIAYWLGVPLDLFQRVEISLGSVSAVSIGEYGPWVLSVNNTGDDLIPIPPT